MERKRLTFKNRAEWLEARTQGIGASEVATVVGLNPWETPYQLWRRKMGIDAPQDENFAMKAGHYLEDAVARFFADESGREVIRNSANDFMFVRTDKPFIRVSPDRTFWLPGMPKNDDNKGILECKTTQKKIDPDDLPKHWFCQVQMNLGVAGYEHGSLAWLTAGCDFGYRDIDFDPDFYGWLCEEVERFWVDNILGKKEPDAVSAADVVAKYATHTEGKTVEVSDTVFEAYASLCELKRDMGELENRKEDLESTLKMAFGDAESITYGGDTLATWKAPKPSKSFDKDLFKAENPELYAKYCIERQNARRFLLK